MARNFRFTVDQKDIVRFLIHKELCAEGLATEDGSYDKDTEVEYFDQPVLANLETKLARIYYAKKMLQVCAMLNPKQKTAGVPNYYLSAWAHLNLSYLWKLRNNTQNCVSD